MIKEAIGTGATVEEAIEAAKVALGAPWDADVSTEVLELPKKKTLGLFGGAPAKARAFYDAPEEKKAPAEKVVKEKPVQKKEEKKVAPAAAPAKKEAASEPKAVTGVTSDMGKVAKDYVVAILKGMGVEDVEISVTEDEESISLDLDCGNGSGYIIGRRGETLDADRKSVV